ncbi:MAG: SH3 domain-containing protein [Thermomicrobiales bacterium]
MTDPGLTNRLRHHSRRSGLMVGLTMALTIAICILGFIWAFVQLEPYVSDFVHRAPSTAEERTSRNPSQQAPANDNPANNQSAQQPSEEPTSKPPTPTPKPKPTATQASTAFIPDYQLTSNGSVNLRSGPSKATNVVTSLSPSQPLQYLGEKQATADPGFDELDPGQSWMKFRTDDGLEGWVREIDVGPYSE